MVSDAKRQLADFVIHKAFDPVLKAKPSGRSATEKHKLEHVQKATRAEVERYRHYGSAAELVTNFKRDLRSAPARKVHSELKQLGLPTINDIEKEFERKADQLGVRASAS